MPYYRSLIGALSGSIIDLSKEQGDYGLANGTHSKVSEDEVSEAGLSPKENFTPATPEMMPEGWKCAPSPDGGVLVYGPGQDLIQEQPFPNLAAARSFAHERVAYLNRESALANGTEILEAAKPEDVAPRRNVKKRSDDLPPKENPTADTEAHVEEQAEA